MKIMFVGSNPSIKSNRQVPFWYDAKSTKVLHDWLHQVMPYHFRGMVMLNVYDNPTPNNRPLKMSEIKASLPLLSTKIQKQDAEFKVVALGRTAEKALTLLGIPHYAMPHPSGLNRKLNDKAYVGEKIKRA